MLSSFNAMHWIAVLCIILGFISLVIQKVYYNPENNQIEIEIPALGKLRTNIPSLVFIFAALLIVYLYPPVENTYQTEWLITGSLDAAEEDIDWSKTKVRLHPANLDQRINPAGDFQIRIKVPNNRQLEDAYEAIIFEHPGLALTTLHLQEEKKKHDKEEASLLKSVGDTSREYSTLLVGED